MRGNSSIIGPKQTTSVSDAKGRFDLYDCYYKRIENTWPTKKELVSISPNSGNTLEGETVNFTVTVSGFSDGDTVYYSIVAVSGTVNTSDFTDSSLTGSFTVNSSGVGSFSKTLTRDNVSETDSYKIQIRDGSISGTIIGESGTFTIPDPVYTVTATASSSDEGTTATFAITGTNVQSGPHYITLSNTAATADDVYLLVSSPLSVAFTFNGTSFNALVNIIEDYLTEGSESLTFNLRVNSTTGPIVASDTITINDTSLTPTATVTPSVSSVNEGSSVTFTVNTTNFASGSLNWETVLSSDMEPDDISATSGTVSISSSTGSIVITATSDGYTETGQTESFQVRILHPDGTGTILATSSSVTINDTSTGTPEPVGIDITSSFYEISNRLIESDTYMGNVFDYNGPYDVGEVQTDFSGTGRVYIGHKATSSPTFYSDVPVAGVQILDSAGTSLLASWIFNTNTGGSGSTWQTYTASITGSSTQGFPVTPATASGYTYANFSTSGNINRFSLASSTGSQYTGAADGIGNTYKLTADGGSNTIATVGDAQISQSSGTYYIFRETSGSALYSGVVMRSPTYSFSGGERIRVIHALTGYSANPMNANDSLYVAVY